MKILIRGGRLIDPKNDLDGKFDILINGATIEKIDKNIHEASDKIKVIDASNHIIAPGLIDIHAHLREPGYEYKETIRHGRRQKEVLRPLSQWQIQRRSTTIKVLRNSL